MHPTRSPLHAHPARALLGALLPLAAAACISSSAERGVPALWRDESAPTFEPGRTTRAEVLEALGPPSQVLSLGDGTALYYLLESTRSNELILLLYNRSVERTGYDRAVFFFDGSGVLTEQALGGPDG